MSQIIVGVADCQISADPASEILTYALGSCIALTLYDPVTKVGGMLHFMLPESNIDPEKARHCPWMFADTGIPLLFRSAYGKGAEKRRLTVSAAGGANVMDAQGTFAIGKRNIVAMRKILWRAGVMLASEAVGGSEARSVRLALANGEVWLREGAQPARRMTGGKEKS